MRRAKDKDGEQLTVEDEPGMAERFQRGLKRAFQMPHKPITKQDKRSRQTKPSKNTPK